MRTPRLILLGAVVICAAAFTGGERQVRVREVVGHDDLRDGQILAEAREIRNGPEARLQLDIGTAVFRLGANSSAKVHGSEPGFQLQNGNCLFADLEGDSSLLIALGTRQFEAVGTGFAHKTEDDSSGRLIVGCIAGKTKVKSSGKTHTIKAGELLIADADGSVTRVDFDLAKQVNTCALMQDFSTALPNQREIEKELARFAMLEKRGFRGPLGRHYQPTSVVEVEKRTRPVLDDFAILSNNDRLAPVVPNPPSWGGVVRVIDDGYSRRDDDDGGSRPVGVKPGHGHGDTNHDHPGPPSHGRPGKGGSR